MSPQTDLAARLYSGKTAIGSVETSEGYITHHRLSTPEGTFDAPVLVAANDEHAGAPAPVRQNGRLVYALPGGGSFAA